MFCRSCGAQNDDRAVRCAQCGAVIPENAPTQSLPTYLVQAVLVTLFCCLPFGIVAIVFAAQVNAKLAGGDYAGALESSNKAKTWCWVAFFCGLIPTVLYFLMVILTVAADPNFKP
jgi:hypothetical protein